VAPEAVSNLPPACGAVRPADGWKIDCLEARAHGDIAIHHGPLHYTLGATHSSKVIKRHPAEPRAVDYQLDAVSKWQNVNDIDPTMLHFHDSRTEPRAPIWDTGG
jgi:hypothetical protein